MSRSGGAVSVLYVGRDGLVCSGRLVSDPRRKGEDGPVLMSRAGRALGPTEVLALLVTHPVSEDKGVALTLAEAAGYRVEET